MISIKGSLAGLNVKRAGAGRTRGSRARRALTAALVFTALACAAIVAHRSASAQSACTSPPSGLVSWWPGDGNANDIRGFNNGTLQGGATFATGEVGQAFSFNGSDAAVSVADATDLRFTSQFTLDAWVNPADLSDFPMILSKFNGGNNSYELHLNPDGSVRSNVSSDGTGLDTLISGAGVVATGTWSHVSTTFNAGVWKIYVNGVEVASKTSSVTSVFPGTADLFIGRDSGTTHFFNGLIDEAEVFNRALSQTEIQAIFNAGSAGKCKPTCHQPPSGMVAWWPGDGDTKDLQNGNNGTLQGNATFAAGKVGQAFSLNGSSAYVEFPDSPSLSVTGQLTVDAWINPNDVSSDQTIVSKYNTACPTNSTEQRSYAMDVRAGGTLQFCVYSGQPNAYHCVQTTGKITPGVFTHVAGTFDPATQDMKIYVNGVDTAAPVLAGSVDVNPIFDSDTPVDIGRAFCASAPNFFGGLIDETEIYNRVLSQSEIQAIFDAGSAGKCQDAVPPTVQSVTRADASPTNAASVHFNVTFSKSVTGVDATDFTLTTTGSVSGASVTGVTGSGANYTVTVNTGTGDGTIRLDVTDDDTIVDAAGNPLGGTGAGNGNFTSGEVYTIDKTAPSVTINQASGQADPTGTSPINFTAVFSEAVTGFASSDVSFTGSTAGGTLSATVTEIAPNNGTTYNVAVSGMTTSGTVVASIPAGAATDAVGNQSTASTSTDNSVTFNNTVPLVSSVTRAGASPTNAASVQFTVTFSQSVTGVDSTDFTLTTTGSVSGASVTGVSGSGAAYTVTVNTGSGSGTIRLDVNDDDSIKDAANHPLGGTGAGNGNFTSGEVYTIDKTPPTVSSITRADSNPTNAASVHFNVTFSESVTGVDPTDFTLTTGSVSGASVSGVAGSGANYTVTVNTGSGDGTIRLDLADDDSIKDAAGNPLGGTGAGNGSFTSGQTYTIDKTVPSISISAPSASLAGVSSSVTYTVTYSDANFNASTLATGNITLNKTGTANATVGVSGTGNMRTVTLSGLTGNGTLGISIAAGTATDTAGNTAPAAGPSATFTVDTTPPAVQSVTRADANPTSAASVHFTVTFSESVSGVDPTDFALTTTGSVSGASVTGVSGSGAAYTVTVNTGSGSGTIRLDVNDNDSIKDAAGNPLGGTGAGNGSFNSGESYTLNRQAGTLQFSSATYSVGESSPAATITVRRTGGSFGAVSVAFATSNAMAQGGASCGAGVDFVNTSGTLSWADGETADKSFNVTVCDDTANEPDETVGLALSNPTGGAALGSPAAATLTILNDDTPVLQFSPSAYSVVEDCTAVQIIVVRTGDPSIPVTVDYQTSDGAASERADYTTALGTLRFAAGETQKTFALLVSEDTRAEADEALTVTLSNPSGGAVLGPAATATVTIHDDADTGAGNSIDDAQTFVRQHYHDFLNREADPGGLQFWTQGITSCGADAGCRQVKRVDTSAAFFLSIEFQRTGFEVIRIYKATFTDSQQRPRGLPRYREFLRDEQEISRGVVVGQGNWQQQLSDNVLNFARAWVQRPEVLSALPDMLPAQAYVDKLFQNAGVTPTQSERDAAIAAFGAGGVEGRARALLSVTDSGSVFNRQYNSAFVLMEYIGYLRRNPDDAPDNNFSGFDFWLNKLNGFSQPGEDMRDDSQAFTRVRRAEMVRAFIESVEYRSRFAP